MMRFFSVPLLVVLTAVLSACTPAEQEYCARMGVPSGSPEHSKCIQYYFDQTAIYRAERNQCEWDADQTYPRTLYDRGRTAYMRGGYGPYGYHGGHSVYIQPDYAHNAMVDQLRMRVIAPCMYSKGWRNPTNWEAGKGPVQAPKHPNRPIPSQPLPWAR